MCGWSQACLAQSCPPTALPTPIRVIERPLTVLFVMAALLLPPAQAAVRGVHTGPVRV